MYRYVSKKDPQAKSYRTECVQLLTEIQKQLKDKLNCHAAITLIGSSSQKMITQNGNGTYDLDFNLMIEKLPLELERDPKKLKNFVRNHLDSVIRDQSLDYSPGKDSTSVITYIKHNAERQEIFSFDLGIVAKISGNNNWNRLLYDKPKGVYIWAQQRDSNKLNSRANKLRKQGHFSDVREIYLKKKNEALKSDEDVSSFALYASAVNEVEQKFNRKKH